MGQDAAGGSQLLDQALDLAERLAEQTESGKVDLRRPRSPRAPAARVDLEALRAAAALLTLSLSRDFFARVGARGRARARRRRPARRRRRRRDRRGRGLRPGRPGCARLPRPDAAERVDVRPTGACLRLPLVRHPLVPEPRLRRGGESGGRARPGARADCRARRDARRAAASPTRGCSARGPAGCARRSGSPATTTACRSTSRRSSSRRGRAPSRSSPAGASGSRAPSSVRGATASPARAT